MSKISDSREKTNKLIIGGLSGIISRTLTAPLELAKIRQQNNQVSTANFSLYKMIKKEGFFSLWKGNYANCIRIFPQNAINYAIYSELTKHNNSVFTSLFAGSVSGAISIASIYPFENARTRLSLQSSGNNAIYNGLIDVFKKTPLSSLYQGLKTSIIGFTPYNAIMFGSNKLLHNMFNTYINCDDMLSINNKTSNRNGYREKINTIYKNYGSFIIGGLAGTIALTITYPTDLLRRRQQIIGLYNSTKTNTNTNTNNKSLKYIVREIIKDEGIIGLYRGIIPAYIKIFPSIALSFYCYDIFENLLQ